MEKNENIYQKLLDAVDKLPPEAVERASKDVTRKGYDTTGYQYQYIVNVMNEICGINGWGYSYVVVKEIEGLYRSGQKYYEVVVDITAWVGDKDTNRVAPGGHQSSAYADARKGAVTNALKKALAMFGVGKKAYEGTIDDDYRAPTPQKSQYKPSTATKTQETTRDTTNSNKAVICTECKNSISSAESNYSLAHYGRNLCRTCQGFASRNPDIEQDEQNYAPF